MLVEAARARVEAVETEAAAAFEDADDVDVPEFGGTADAVGRDVSHNAVARAIGHPTTSSNAATRPRRATKSS